MKTVLITGCAGFIGSHSARKFLEQEFNVIGIDSISNYYSKDLKRHRIDNLLQEKNFQFQEGNICDLEFLNNIFAKNKIETVVHLAAQAGVRLKLDQSFEYINANIQGFLNIINRSLDTNVENFLYASSSSVYGDTALIPYSESELNLNPTSIYGISKLTNEKIAFALARSASMRFRGMRFFTVYGPEGRPDMAYFKLISSALTGTPFNLYGDGTVRRDFTYIDDIINSLILLESDLQNRKNGFNDIVNIGGGNPVSITTVIAMIETLTKCKININKYPPNALDLRETCADFTYLNLITNQKPLITIEEGLKRTINWALSQSVRPIIRKWADSV